MWDPASFGPSSLGVYHYVGPSLVSPELQTRIPVRFIPLRSPVGALTTSVGPGYPPVWDPASFALACGTPHNGNRPVGRSFHFQTFILSENWTSLICKASCVVSSKTETKKGVGALPPP